MIEDRETTAAHLDIEEAGRAIASATVVVVDNLDRQLVVAGMEHTGRYLVTTLDGIATGGTHTVAVDPGHIGIVDETEGEQSLAAGEGVGHGELSSGPDHAVHPGERRVGPQTGHSEGLPVTLVVRGGIPACGFATVGSHLTLEAGVVGKATQLVGTEGVGAELLHELGILGETVYRPHGHPALNLGAAPTGVDDAHGTAERHIELFGEEVAHSGEAVGSLGGGHSPVAAHIVGRTARQGVVDFKEAYAGISGMANLVVGTVDAAQTEVHIGLATGHPHLASEDVGHGEALLAG